MRYFLSVCLLLACISPGYALGGGPRWGKQLLRILGVKTETSAALASGTLEKTIQQQVTQYQVQRAAVSALWQPTAQAANEKWRLPFQSMAAQSSADIVPLTQADADFNFINDRLAQIWQKLIARDLMLLQQRKGDILNSLQVSYPRRPISYAALIPPEAKYIQVGEEHGFAPLRKAFEELVFQYQALYPKRKIIVLTEFVFDRPLPLSEKTGEPVSALGLKYRRVSADFRFLEKFVKNGIEVIGLEDERFFRNHQRLITPVFRQVESVYGMKQRNEHWRKIIKEVRHREPHAVFFIYTGNMHVHYRAPFSLARASSQVFVLQLQANELGEDLPFGAVMQNEPFGRVPDGARYPTLLTWKNESPYRVLSGFDACLIFPAPKMPAETH